MFLFSESWSQGGGRRRVPVDDGPERSAGMDPGAARRRSRPPVFDPGWAVFLDVDGTLLHLAPTPDEVCVPPRTRAFLEALCAATQGAVALISGRSIGDLDSLFEPLKLPAAGLHGLERRNTRGKIQHQPAGSSGLPRIVQALREYARLHPGIIIEDKGLSVAVHFRGAPAQEDAATRLTRQYAEELGPAYHVQPGKMMVELRPAGRNKGLAIREFLGEKPFAGRTPVFIGDDLTDEDAFRVVNDLGGHSVKVGEGTSLARWRLRGPEAVMEWLRP